MNTNTQFPRSLKITERHSHIQEVLIQRRSEVDGILKSCTLKLQDAVAQMRECEKHELSIVEKINSIRQQHSAEKDRRSLERESAQKIFDSAMRGNVESKQIDAANSLSKAEIALQTFSQWGPDVLRLQALEKQVAAAGGDVKAASLVVAAAQEALRAAEYQKACIDYDEVVGNALVAAARLFKANAAQKTPSPMYGFLDSSFWISSGHNAISHLQNPPAEPVNIGGFYFKSLLLQAVDSDFLLLPQDN